MSATPPPYSLHHGQHPLSSGISSTIPPIPERFPDIETLTANEVSNLLADEQLFQVFFENLNYVKELRRIRDQSRDNNENLAQKNLSHEKDLNIIKREVSALQQAVKEKKMVFDQKAQRQQGVMMHYTPASLVDKLSTAAIEAEQESDNIAEQFVDGKLETKDFLKKFMEKRKVYHMRSAKKEFIKNNMLHS